MESLSTDPWLPVRSLFPMEVLKKKNKQNNQPNKPNKTNKKKLLQEMAKIWIKITFFHHILSETSAQCSAFTHTFTILV